MAEEPKMVAEEPKMLAALKAFFADRIHVSAVLIVACFIGVLTLESQSAASYPSYLLALFMLATVREWNDVFRVRGLWLVIALVGYLGCTVLWSEPFDKRDIVTYLGRGLLIFVFVVAFAECQIRGQVQRWLGKALALMGSVVVATAMVFFYQTDPADGRMNGLGQLDTHVIAALVSGVTLLFVLDLWHRERSSVWRAYAVAATILILVGVYMSDSRNAWASVLIGCIAFSLAHTVKDRQKFLVSGIAAVFLLAVVIVVLATSDVLREWLLPRGDSHRPEIWAHALQRVLFGDPIFGLGIATDDDVLVGDLRFDHAHNMYLAVFFKGGIIGFVLMLGLIARCGYTLLKNYADADAKLGLSILALTLSAYLLDGHELLDKVGETWFLFWLPVAIAVGLEWRPRAAQPDEHGL